MKKGKRIVNFLEANNINASKVKEILLNIGVRDFCYAVDNKNPNFAHENCISFVHNMN